MAAYRRVNDSHLQADCQEPGSAPEPYARYRVWATFTFDLKMPAAYRLLRMCNATVVSSNVECDDCG